MTGCQQLADVVARLWPLVADYRSSGKSSSSSARLRTGNALAARIGTRQAQRQPYQLFSDGPGQLLLVLPGDVDYRSKANG